MTFINASATSMFDIDPKDWYDRQDQKLEKKIRLCKQERKFAAPHTSSKRGQSRRSKRNEQQ